MFSPMPILSLISHLNFKTPLLDLLLHVTGLITTPHRANEKTILILTAKMSNILTLQVRPIYWLLLNMRRFWPSQHFAIHTAQTGVLAKICTVRFHWAISTSRNSYIPTSGIYDKPRFGTMIHRKRNRTEPSAGGHWCIPHLVIALAIFSYCQAEQRKKWDKD